MQNFNQLSYQQFISELRQLMSSSAEWNNTIPSETGNILLSMLASITTSTEFFTSRRLQESFLETGQSPIGVLTTAKMLANSIQSKNPSIANIDFSRDINSFSLNYVLPAYSLWTINGKSFFNGSEIYFSNTQASGTFQLIEGNEKTETFISDGTPYQKYYVSQGFLSGKNLVITAVDPVTKTTSEWIRVTSIIEDGRKIDFNSDGSHISRPQNVYESCVYPDGTVQIKFGDGKFGNIPVAGSTISIKYYEVSGGLLNGLTATNEVSIVSTPTTFDLETFQSEITLFNCTNVSSGSSEPSYHFYKSFSSSYFASRDRQISIPDLESSLLNFTYSGTNFRPIKAVRCKAERDSRNPNPLLANTVTPVMLIDHAIITDENFKRELSNFLSDNCGFCAVLPIPAEVVTLSFTMEVYGDTGQYSRSEVVSLIEDALTSLVKITTYINSSGDIEWDFSSADNTCLGRAYSKSDFYKVISETLPGISFDIDFNYQDDTRSVKLEDYQALGMDFNSPDTLSVSFS